LFYPQRDASRSQTRTRRLFTRSNRELNNNENFRALFNPRNQPEVKPASTQVIEDRINFECLASCIYATHESKKATENPEMTPALFIIELCPHVLIVQTAPK
jgi:hypothetical protein